MAKKNFQPHWRPNYRITSTLPDIKVVRTDFIINSIALGLAVFSAFFLFQREYRANSLAGVVADLEHQVADATPQDKKNVATNEEFRSSGRYIEELQKYYNTPFDPHELMVKMSNLVPAGLVFNQIVMDETVVKQGKESYVGYQIRINGSVSDLPILEQFKGVLRESDFLNPEGYTADVGETVSAPDAVTRIFPFQMTIQVEPSKGGKK